MPSKEFVAGLQAMREMVARFVEQQGEHASPGNVVAQSIRANWWPCWGVDPGRPRMVASDYVEPADMTPKNGELYFDIGKAVELMRFGNKVARRGWNGKEMWLQLQTPDLHSKMTLPYVYMRTVQRDLVPWLCSQSDLLATDWFLVN